MTRKRAAILIAAAAVTVVGAVALWWQLAAGSSGREWVTDAGSLGGLDPNALMLLPADDTNDQRLMTLEELRAKYPFDVELPKRLPAGYRLVTLTLAEAGHRTNSSLQDRLSARYASAGDEAEFRVDQGMGDDLGSIEGAEETRVRGARAYYLERLVEGIEFDWLLWARCGRAFAVQSNFGAFTREELVRIAESVGPEDCGSG